MTGEERKVILASSVGTVFEWYDFYIYGTLATILAKQFFSGVEPPAAFIFTLLAFAAGFAVRPFGALLFGHIGDLVGRKYTFIVTITCMGMGTFLIGVLPSFATAGMAAPVLLIAMRLLQGLALGGEYGGAAIYVAEHAPADRRGLYTSWIQTTATLGLFVALLLVLGVRTYLGEGAFAAWGWRLPLLLSRVLLAVSRWIRLKLSESPMFLRMKEEGNRTKAPLKEAFGTWRYARIAILALLGATAGEAVVWYGGQFYALFFLTTTLSIKPTVAQIMIVIALALGTPFFILFGWLSDRIGRKPIMRAGFVLAIITYWPVFTWLGTFKDNPTILCLLVFYMVILVTMVYGPIAAFLVELFPARIRYTSMSLPYHVGNGVFGGGVPFIATALATAFTGIPLIGLLYPMAVAAIGVVVSTVTVREPTHAIKIWDEVGGPR